MTHGPVHQRRDSSKIPLPPFIPGGAILLFIRGNHLLCGQHEFAETWAPVADLGEHQGAETLQQFSLYNKTIFLEIACSPGDLSHSSGHSGSSKHTGCRSDLKRNCLKKCRDECWYPKSLINDLV